ncbi:hypothetical protein PV11_01750 [Exophiala sideris]|uniref:Uncharacterized protein n=1 Tax=Exophiala sideris TaxID=1016849 RepID=A0A0D1WBK9_9EURO|nr:hypothetical protein PV11_01750 [Exophiala sideris]
MIIATLEYRHGHSGIEIYVTSPHETGEPAGRQLHVSVDCDIGHDRSLALRCLRNIVHPTSAVIDRFLALTIELSRVNIYMNRIILRSFRSYGEHSHFPILHL